MSLRLATNELSTHKSIKTASEPIAPIIDGFSVDGIDDTALDPEGGQTVVLIGKGFKPGATVLVGGNTIGVVTVVNSTKITFTSETRTSGTYNVFVINQDGGTAILTPGLIYSGLPTFITEAGSLGSYYETTTIDETVEASEGNDVITYSVVSGSLPTGATLNSNGTITGTSPIDGGSTTYTFTVQATDEENQDSTRQFSITVNVDVVTWSSPSDGVSIDLAGNEEMANVTLSATSAAGYDVSYAANVLPTGVSLNNGVISGTPTDEETVETLLTATANTTNRSATRTVTWVVSLGDAFFNQTTLLLNADDNTFITDASDNAFTITPNGDTRPSAFSPYNTSWSNYFDGSGDYLTIATSTAFGYGTGDFTIEFWTLWGGTLNSLNGGTFVELRSAVLAEATVIYLSTSGVINFYDGPANTEVSSGITITRQWTHIALARESGVWRLFVNGTLAASRTNNSDLGSSKPCLIGQGQNGTTTGYNGYISNVRLIKGTAVYTSAFTAPTQPLTAIANTSLLLNFNNYAIYDHTQLADRLELYGNTSTSAAQNKYLDKSIYFDGNGDYIFINKNDYHNITGDFTIETWVRLDSLPTADNWPTTWSGHMMLFTIGTPSAAAGIGFLIGSNRLALQNNDTPYWSNSHNLSTGQWYHLAVSRSGNTLYFFKDGQSLGTASFTAAASIGSGVYIGSETGQGAWLHGHLEDLRVTHNLARYTADFTPPVRTLVPFISITPPGLYTSNASASYGSTLYFNFVAAANTIVSGTQLPYTITGVEANSLAGGTVAGNLTIIDNVSSLTVLTNPVGASANLTLNVTLPDNSISSANVRLENGTSNAGLAGDNLVFWGENISLRYYDQTLADNTELSYTITGITDADVVGDLPSQPMQVLNGLATLIIPTEPNNTSYVNASISVTLPNSSIVNLETIIQPSFKFQSSANLTLGDWNHIAVSRQESNIRVYVNGVLGNVANISEYNYGESATSLVFGGISDKYFQGRLADTHFISNQAIYTDSVYTVPETRTTTQANTKLLAFGRSIENTSIFPDASTSNHVITASAGVTNVYDSPVWYDNYTREIGFGSAYFDGTGDYLSLAAGGGDFGTQDFTIEYWVYPIAWNTWNMMVGSRGGAINDGSTWSFGINATGYPFIYSDGFQISGTAGQVPLNTWTHLAVSRLGSTMRLFVNGSLVQTSTTSQNYTQTALSVGANRDGSDTLIGQLAGLRLLKGTALYTATFTPPTSPLTAIANTSLLLNFDNPTVYDEIKNLAVSFAGGAGPTTEEKLNQQFSIDCTGTKYLRLSPTAQRVNMAGTDTWSLEFTFKNASIISGTDIASWGNRPSFAPWVFYVDGTSLRFYSSSNNSSWNIASNLQVIGTMAVGTWYKIRLSRTAAGYSIYVDDSLVASAANTGNFYTPTTNYIIFGAAANAGLQSSIYVEGIRINNTGLEFQSEYIPGQRNISELSSSRTHTYPNNYFSTKPTNPSILTYPDKKINSSIQPTTQQLNTGQIFTLQVNNTENKLQYIQTSSNLDLIEQITINNNPALERNPRTAGQEITTQPPVLKRFWY